MLSDYLFVIISLKLASVAQKGFVFFFSLKKKRLAKLLEASFKEKLGNHPLYEWKKNKQYLPGIGNFSLKPQSPQYREKSPKNSVFRFGAPNVPLKNTP